MAIIFLLLFMSACGVKAPPPAYLDSSHKMPQDSYLDGPHLLKNDMNFSQMAMELISIRDQLIIAANTIAYLRSWKKLTQQHCQDATQKVDSFTKEYRELEKYSKQVRQDKNLKIFFDNDQEIINATKVIYECHPSS